MYGVYESFYSFVMNAFAYNEFEATLITVPTIRHHQSHRHHLWISPQSLHKNFA